MRKVAVVWFRNDLRIHDNEALAAANNEALSVLPVFCFDPVDFGMAAPLDFATYLTLHFYQNPEL